MTLLYHASPIGGLEEIKPMKETKKKLPIGGFGDEPKKYACYTNDPSVAFWWASHLQADRGSGVWYIYEVELPPFVPVEICVDYFHFEKVGRFTTNRNEVAKAKVDKDSGEINVYEPLNVKRVFARIEF